MKCIVSQHCRQMVNSKNCYENKSHPYTKKKYLQLQRYSVNKITILGKVWHYIWKVYLLNCQRKLKKIHGCHFGNTICFHSVTGYEGKRFALNVTLDIMHIWLIDKIPMLYVCLSVYLSVQKFQSSKWPGYNHKLWLNMHTHFQWGLQKELFDPFYFRQHNYPFHESHTLCKPIPSIENCIPDRGRKDGWKHTAFPTYYDHNCIIQEESQWKT